MKIFIPSDLHRVDGTDADEFRGCDEAFVERLKTLDFDLLVINGDLDDLQQGSQEEIDKAHAVTNDYFSQHNFIHIIGNHDRKTKKTTIKEFYFEMSDGRKGLVIHGDKSDWRMFFTSKLIGLFGLLERIDPAFRDIDNPEKWAKKAHKKAQKKMDKYVLKLFKKGYDIVVVAHIHIKYIKRGFYKGREVIHANSGHCMHGQVEGIMIDTGACTVEAV